MGGVLSSMVITIEPVEGGICVRGQNTIPDNISIYRQLHSSPSGASNEAIISTLVKQLRLDSSVYSVC